MIREGMLTLVTDKPGPVLALCTVNDCIPRASHEMCMGTLNFI